MKMVTVGYPYWISFLARIFGVKIGDPENIKIRISDKPRDGMTRLIYSYDVVKSDRSRGGGGSSKMDKLVSSLTGVDVTSSGNKVTIWAEIWEEEEA